MSRYTRTPVTSGFEVQSQLNQNFTDIQTAIDDTLSRLGDSPNQMEADMDMNSHRIYNLPQPTSPTEPVTYGMYLGNATIGEIYGSFSWTAVSSASQVLFTGITPTYSPGTGNLSVYVNGVRQHPSAYSETTSSSVTFTSGLDAGDEVLFVVNEAQVSGGIPASLASTTTWTQNGSGAVSRTVDSKLREIVSPLDFGAIGDGVTDDTSAVQTAINSLQAGQTLDFAGKSYKTATGFTITNKSRIKLKGSKAKVFLSGAGSSAYIFQLSGTIDDLEISDFDLSGDNNSSYFQTAIGCNSGQTVTNTRFHSNKIYNINVGISHNADLSGSWDKGECYDNFISNMVGVNAGQGYGVHCANATNIIIKSNIFDACQRHSMYLAKGTQVNVLCTGNIIKNHRNGVAASVARGAIECIRISGVTLSNNKFVDCYDCQINIGHDTSASRSGYNILVSGNTFTNRKNAVAAILVGEQLTPTSYFTSRITISDNVFEEDSTVATGATIRINNGTQISIKDNSLYRYNTAGALSEFVEAGVSSYISSDAHIGDIVVEGNTVIADASVASTRAVYVTNQLCTGSSYYKIKDNFIKGFASEFYFPVTPTNVNSKLKFQSSYTTDYSSTPANSVATNTHTINGVKQTSMVSIRPQNSIGPNMGFQAFASDAAVNTIVVWRQNPTGSAIDMGSQTYLVFVEDL